MVREKVDIRGRRRVGGMVGAEFELGEQWNFEWGASEVVDSSFPATVSKLPRIYIRAGSDIIPTSSVGVQRRNHWRDILAGSTTDRALDPF